MTDQLTIEAADRDPGSSPVVDRLGRQHHHDHRGRFARKADGGVNSLSIASRLTSGRDLLPNVDGRSLIYKRFKEIVKAIAVDQGGADRLSAARVQLIKRFGAAAVLAEQMEIRLANGTEIDVAEYSLLCSTLTRLATRIGVDRIPRDLSPRLDEYLHQQEAADE